MIYTVRPVFVNDHPKGATHVRLNGATFRVSLGTSNCVYFYLVLPPFSTVFLYLKLFVVAPQAFGIPP